MQFGPLDALPFLAVVFGIVAFFALRFVVLWYFRINHIIAQLERIAAALEAEIAAVDTREPPTPPSA